MIDDAKLNELLALAEKATPGKRKWTGDGVPDFFGSLDVEVGPGWVKPIASAVADHDNDGWINIHPKDAAFIAALDPETIKALVEEVKEKRFRLASLEK